MQISIKVEEMDEKKDLPLLTAKFTMVARGTSKHQNSLKIETNDQLVNPLKLETDLERKLYQLGAG